MGSEQLEYPEDLADMAAWIASVSDPGCRVLEIGSGDGELTGRLAADGIDVIGVDPHATQSTVPNDRVRAVAFEEFDDAPFDVVFASVSLHHLPRPDATIAALRRLTHPGTVLLVREFDKVLLDHPPTLQWWFHQRRARAATTGEPVGEESFDEFIDRWREQMDHHVLPWSTVREAILAAGFVTEAEIATPYLFRWGLDEAIRPLEESLIALGRIRCVGLRWSGRRAES
jgi:ubiquinone/menaquinone biosynthesis C-methylase UbiE